MSNPSLSSFIWSIADQTVATGGMLEIDAELKGVTDRALAMIDGLTK